MNIPHYNDVLNYNTSITEFLYQSGFESIYRGIYFPEPGNLIYESISIPVSHYPITENNIDKISIVFAANEPNFEIPFPLIDQIEEKRSVDHFIYLISDYNNPVENSVYFFFQGYLALQWYHHYKFYKAFPTFIKKFNSMSRLIGGMRDYRLYLTSKLCHMNLIKYGDVSCSSECPYSKQSIEQILDSKYCFLKPQQIDHIREHLKTPLRFDYHHENDIPNTSFEIDWRKMGESFLHVINETVFYNDFNHLTEKTFRPIICERPFIITSTPRSLRYLRRYGFKTFGKWIDESYDEEPDHHKRLDMITEQIEVVCKTSPETLNKMYKDMRPVLEHNRALFYGYFEKIILDELIINFKSVSSG